MALGSIRFPQTLHPVIGSNADHRCVNGPVAIRRVDLRRTKL
jgi:hypothetical protein